MKKTLLVLSVWVTLATTWAWAAEKAATSGCLAAKEYVTALEFLRSGQGSDALASDKDAQKIALQVSEGCNGAASRFVRTTVVVFKAGLIPPDAIRLGQEFAKRSDAETDTFLHVFKTAFLEEGLDLDLMSSVQMARSLTTEFDGDTENARKDFDRVLEFCRSSKGLDLPVPQCGLLAARIARKGQPYEKGAAKDFLSAYDFTASKKGANLITGTSLKLAEELVGMGPGAVENFTQAYRYAVSKSGLNLEAARAISFAKEMAGKAKGK